MLIYQIKEFYLVVDEEVEKVEEVEGEGVEEGEGEEGEKKLDEEIGEGNRVLPERKEKEIL